MKKILITMTFLTLGLGAMAQQDSQQPNDDQLQQQAPRETQAEVERAAAREARRQEAEKKQKETEAIKREDSLKKVKPKSKP